MEKIKQVIVLRKDLRNKNGHKVHTGKLVSQGAHASMKVITDCIDWSDYYMGGNCIAVFKPTDEMWLWLKRQPFTKITLAVNSREELLKIYEIAKKQNLPCSLITDNALTEFSEPTDTCIAIGPANSEDIDKITGHLSLF
jgi:PTH2 family peptidyl-tRNA hydrolase